MSDEENTLVAGQLHYYILVGLGLGHINQAGQFTFQMKLCIVLKLDYTISYLASGVSVSYLQKCQLYEAL
jgi:hypothetical protein